MKRLGIALLLLLVSQLALADGGVIQPGTNTTCSGGGVAAACNNFGTSAVATTGTSGHTIPFLDGANTWSGAQQTFGNGTTIDSATGSLNVTASSSQGLNVTNNTNQPIISKAGATIVRLGNSGNDLVNALNFTQANNGSSIGWSGANFNNSSTATIGGVVYNPIASSVLTAEQDIGFRFAAATATITGSYATQRFNRVDQPTFSAASSLTLTTASNSSVNGPPIAAGSATITTGIGLWVQAGATVAGGGTETTAVGFQVDAPTGGGTNKTAVLNGTGVFTPGLTTGTNADFICMAAGGQLLIQGSACTISSLRFKHDVKPLTGSAIAEIAGLEPVSFVMNGENRDANAMRLQIGLTAENVAAVDDRLAVYEDDGVTPKSYRQEAVLALAVAAIKEQQQQIEALRAEVARLRR